MKAIVAFLAVLALGSAAAEDLTAQDVLLNDELIRAGIADQFIDVIENIKKECQDKGGDPLKIVSQELNISNPYLTLLGSVSNVSVENLCHFLEQNVEVSLIPLSIAITIPWDPIVAIGNYDLDGNLLGLIPAYGKGSFRAELEGLYVKVFVALSQSGGHVVIKTLEIDFGIKRCYLNVTGFGGGDLGDLISEMVSDNAVRIVEQIKLGYMDTIISTVTQLGNAWLSDKSMQDIINMITGKTTAAPRLTTPSPILKRHYRNY